MTQTKLSIGCSAFSTLSWQPLFYPENLPQKDWFNYYCRYFNTYEFNASFYRFPAADHLKKWYCRTPPDFTFSIKAPKLITHEKKMKDCDREITTFYQEISNGLKDKLACVLWQFPPGFTYDEERLQTITEKLAPNFKNVIEFRHMSWWLPHVMLELASKNITFCTPSYPGLPDTIIQNTNIGYFRFHGIPRLFYSEYSAVALKTFYNELSTKKYDEIYVYFNNTASSAAIINAFQLIKLQNG